MAVGQRNADRSDVVELGLERAGVDGDLGSRVTSSSSSSSSLRPPFDSGGLVSSSSSSSSSASSSSLWTNCGQRAPSVHHEQISLRVPGRRQD